MTFLVAAIILACLCVAPLVALCYIIRLDNVLMADQNRTRRHK